MPGKMPALPGANIKREQNSRRSLCSSVLICVLVLQLVSAACGKPANNRSDVERAVREYLTTRPGFSSMEMEIQIQDVTFEQDRAQAVVLFRSKSQPGSSMRMRYNLTRVAARAWRVAGAQTQK